MKRIVLIVLCLWTCLYTNAQIAIEKAKTDITDQMASFGTVLDYLNADDDERFYPEDANKIFGGDYFQYNSIEYSTLGKWLKHYYSAQLKDEILQHTIKVDVMSVKKVSDSPADKRYSFNAVLARETGQGKDFRIKDVNVTFIVVVEENEGVYIQEIKGDWAVRPIYPEYEWKYYLEVPNHQSNIDADGEKQQFAVHSWAQKMKVYKGIQTLATEETVNVPVEIESNNIGAEIKDNQVNVNFRYNYSRETKYHKLVLNQQRVNGDVTGNGLRKSLDFVQAGQEKDETWFERITRFDKWHDPNIDIKLYYGLDNTTFGLGASYCFEDTRLTLGFYGAMCKNRISQIEWGIVKTISQSTNLSLVIPGTTTNIGSTVIVDKNGASVQVENYTEKVVDVIKPTEKGYSQTMDPDGEAVYKKVYSYIMAMPGVYMNDWVHFDLGLGVARTQETYKMEDAYQINVIEKSYTKDGVTETQTENKYERTRSSFLYKDASKFHFAVRPGINLRIPVSSNEHYLKFGVGYTFVPSDKDANNLDFSLGFAFPI